MREYRFLIDNDSQSASVYFQKRVVTFAQAKLNQAAPDSEVVATAREMECIIVTANDWTPKGIKQFLQKSQRKDCFDLFGLCPAPPNPAAIQARVLPGLSDKLRIKGKANLVGGCLAGKLSSERPLGWVGGYAENWVGVFTVRS